MDNLKTLFDLALAAESIMRNFYRHSTQLFCHVPRLVDFCKNMEKDESLHIEKLLALRDALSPEKLRQRVDPKDLKAMKEIRMTFPDEILKRIETLDDFFELAHEMESSEINALFQSLLKEYSPSPRETRAFLFLHDAHQENLMALSKEFNLTERRKIRTQMPLGTPLKK